MRILGALMSLVFSGSGLLAALSEYAPERSTRFDMAGPLFGDAAVSFGITIAIFGLMPLALCAKTPRGAGIFASACALLALSRPFLVVAVLKVVAHRHPRLNSQKRAATDARW